MFRDIFLGLFSFIFGLLFVLIGVAIGWFVIWKLFLSKFKFVRELIGGMQEEENNSKTDEIRISRKGKNVRKD